jgi:O-antigen ligase
MMARVTALLGAALAACSLGRHRVWRERFALALVATAVSIVLLGCAQRWTGATDIFWGPRRLDYFFGTYRNVTSAGEYLNLALPVAGAAAWIALERSPARRAATVCALAILIAGVLIGGSKAAPLVAAACGGAFLFAQRRELARRLIAKHVVILLVLMLAVALMAWGAGWGVSQDRWARLFASNGEVTLGNRLEVDRACLSGIGAAGWTGAGPGTFPVLFPGLQAASAHAPEGRWLAAHNDYLQTFLEWGVLGVLSWSVYFFGSLGRLITGLHRRGWRRDDRAWALGFALALIGAAVMAAVDFPLQVASLQLDVAVLAGLGWSSSRWPRARVFREPRIVLRGERRLLPSSFTRWVDRRCCEYDLSGSVDPKTGTNSKP